MSISKKSKRTSFRLVLCTIALSLCYLSQGIPSAYSAAPQTRLPTTSLYPVWENTAYIEKHQELFIGTTGIQYGILNKATVGFLPIQFFYRAPNIHAKFPFIKRSTDWDMALQVGYLRLLEEASNATFSPLYTSGLSGQHGKSNVLPVSLSASWNKERFLVHQTLTALGVYAEDKAANGVTIGYSNVAEYQFNAYHSVQLHFSEIGFWNHDFIQFGPSYRYQGSNNEFQLGCLFRFRAGMNERAPQISFGFNI